MKMPLRDAYGGARGLRLSSTTVGRRTKCSTLYRHTLRMTRRGVYSRAAFISLSASKCAAFIRGRRLFEGGVYSRAASIRRNTVDT